MSAFQKQLSDCRSTFSATALAQCSSRHWQKFQQSVGICRTSRRSRCSSSCPCPRALTPTYAGLLVCRFLTGYFGSPCLATGGATIQDLYAFLKLPYGFSAWVAANFSAPAVGPLLSGFSVPALGWRWSLYEVLMMTAPVFVMMWVAFRETSAANILLRRARRLRKLTGNQNFKSQSELDQGNMTPKQIAFDALVKPMQIMIQDPAVFFTNVYSAFIYGVFYSFFEAFPLVYIDMYGFSIGVTGIGETPYPYLKLIQTC